MISFITILLGICAIDSAYNGETIPAYLLLVCMTITISTGLILTELRRTKC